MARAGRRRAGRSRTTDFTMVTAEPGEAVSEPDEHRVRLERQAQEAAYPQQRAGARIRWVAAGVAGLVVLASGVLLVTVSRSSEPRPVALSSVPLAPATAQPTTSSASRPPTQAAAPPPTLTTSVSATQSGVAQPPPKAPSCPAANTAAFNDDTRDITYNGSWRVSSDRGLGDFGDDVHFTKSDGNFVSFSFQGSGISLFTETNNDEGRIDILLDGAFQRTVDATSATRRAQQAVFTVCGLSPGFHNIRAIKRSGEYMLVDRFDVTT